VAVGSRCDDKRQTTNDKRQGNNTSALQAREARKKKAQSAARAEQGTTRNKGQEQGQRRCSTGAHRIYFQKPLKNKGFAGQTPPSAFALVLRPKNALPSYLIFW
jgi:hypothetical protein